MLTRTPRGNASGWTERREAREQSTRFRDADGRERKEGERRRSDEDEGERGRNDETARGIAEHELFLVSTHDPSRLCAPSFISLSFFHLSRAECSGS